MIKQSLLVNESDLTSEFWTVASLSIPGFAGRNQRDLDIVAAILRGRPCSQLLRWNPKYLRVYVVQKFVTLLLPATSPHLGSHSIPADDCSYREGSPAHPLCFLCSAGKETGWKNTMAVFASQTARLRQQFVSALVFLLFRILKVWESESWC